MLPITLTPKNNQQAFDMAARHLLQMAERSVDHSDANAKCVYRNSNGNRCVIGAMISDEDYDPSIDNGKTTDGSFMLTNVLDLCVDGYLITHPDVDPMLLSDLQSCHDEVKNWAADGYVNIGALREIAKRYVLSASIFDVIYLENREEVE